MKRKTQPVEQEAAVQLKADIGDEKYLTLRVALNCSVLSRAFPAGSQVGFKVGRKHFVIHRDE